MKISFKIRERLSEVIAEIMHSDKWHTLIKEEKEDHKHILIKDHDFESEASIEIRQNEIHIRPVWLGNYTYHICQKGDGVWCEYNGSDKGLLAQKLLPRITPKEKILNVVIPQKTSRHKKSNEEKAHTKGHLSTVYDEFIKIGVPMPPIFD